MTPTLPLPARPADSWLSRNARWFVPTIVLGSILLFAALVASVFAMVFGLIKSSDAYKEALARAKGDPAVARVLGTPVTEGYLVTGKINVSGGSGRANLAIPVSGPNAKGTIYVEATKSEGRWDYRRLSLVVEGSGERIDLLKGRTAG